MKSAIHNLIAVCVLASGAFAGYYEINDGEYEYGIRLEGADILIVDGGGADQITAYDNSSIEVLDTSVPLGLDVGGIYALALNDNSHLYFSNGALGSFRVYENANAVFLAGRIDYISSFQYVLSSNQNYIPHIEIVSTEYDFASSTNILTGVWMDDSTFDIQLVDQSGYDPVIENIFFTPEPATLCMMGVGVLLLRRRTKLQ